jgi:hypothetical protein
MEISGTPIEIAAEEGETTSISGRLVNVPVDLTMDAPDLQEQLQVADHSDGPQGNDVQNNIDDLWTWSLNGAKIAGSLAIFTGSVKLIQAVMAYWRDEVLTLWDRAKRRWNRLSTGLETSDDSEDEEDYDTADEVKEPEETIDKL